MEENIIFKEFHSLGCDMAIKVLLSNIEKRIGTFLEENNGRIRINRDKLPDGYDQEDDDDDVVEETFAVKQARLFEELQKKCEALQERCDSLEQSHRILERRVAVEVGWPDHENLNIKPEAGLGLDYLTDRNLALLESEKRVVPSPTPVLCRPPSAQRGGGGEPERKEYERTARGARPKITTTNGPSQSNAKTTREAELEDMVLALQTQIQTLLNREQSEPPENPILTPTTSVASDTSATSTHISQVSDTMRTLVRDELRLALHEYQPTLNPRHSTGDNMLPPRRAAQVGQGRYSQNPTHDTYLYNNSYLPYHMAPAPQHSQHHRTKSNQAASTGGLAQRVEPMPYTGYLSLTRS